MSRKVLAKPTPKTTSSSTPAKAAGSAAPAGVVTISVDNEAIQKLAFELSQQPKSYDDFVWIFAESELRLRPAYVMSNIFKPEGPVQVYPGKIVQNPREDDIRKLAEQIASQCPPIQDLHWFIAERTYIYNKAKSAKR